jgi:lipoprotein-anchoring transpeptidase ErfK/SrfK
MRLPLLSAASALLLATACQPAGDQQQAGGAQQEANRPPPPDLRQIERDRARQEAGELRFVVDLSERRVIVFRGEQELRTEPVAVGQSDHPTPTGSWTFTRVDLNPDWTPPDSEWAEDREPKDPGEEGNPMGRARLVFNEPYTIHGTTELDSLGRAASHGSIRASNEVVIQLAEMLLRAGGAWEGDSWFQDMLANPNRMHRIDLPNPVPIEVRD